MTDAPDTRLRSFQGLRVCVVGLGVEGVDAARFLQQEGAARIVLSDARPAEALAARLADLGDLDYDLRAGGNDPAIADEVDALIVSQGVPRDLSLLQAAEARGLPVTAMMRLFLQRCPAPTIGITGSAGKTTTTSLVGAIFAAAGRPAFVGGNIGAGLLSELHRITAETPVVLEISHTQLLRTDRSPHIAAVLNVTPNHLDQFRWDEYVDLKRNLVRYQAADDIVVLPAEEPVARRLGDDTPARRVWFGLDDVPVPGAARERGMLVWRDERGSAPVLPASAVPLIGAHNLRNAAAAIAIAAVAGLPVDAMAAALRDFRGVPHRLETVGVVDGVRYINDSIATTPERTLAALLALDSPVVVLLGGRDKKLPLEALASRLREQARAVVCFGESGPIFAAGLRAEGVAAVEERADLAAAFARAVELAQPGDAVLMAPAGTSFDAYEHFAARGDHFRRLVADLSEGAAHGAR